MIEVDSTTLHRLRLNVEHLQVDILCIASYLLVLMPVKDVI